MRKAIRNIRLTQILTGQGLEISKQPDGQLMKKSNKNNARFKKRINIAFKKISFLFNISPNEAKTEEYNSPDYLVLNIPNEKEISLLTNIIRSERQIIRNVINNFDDKYTTPFLLYSIGYKYEEVASILQLPPAIVKSRVFYLQKKMQRLLTDMSTKND